MSILSNLKVPDYQMAALRANQAGTLKRGQLGPKPMSVSATCVVEQLEINLRQITPVRECCCPILLLRSPSQIWHGINSIREHRAIARLQTHTWLRK